MRRLQCESPFPEERRQFLRHLQDLGYARNSLHAVACELVVIVRHLDLSGRNAVDRAVVDRVRGVGPQITVGAVAAPPRRLPRAISDIGLCSGCSGWGG